MKKRGLALVLVLVLAAAGLGAAWQRYRQYDWVLEANWGLTLPREAHLRQVYKADSGVSPHGDGLRYHVFSCREGAPLQQLLPWQKETEGEKADAAAGWLHELQVPPEERPDYDACLMWYQTKDDHDELLLLWEQGQGRLYVLESFI